MKKILKKIFILISKLIIPIFYKKTYLKGRWFENGVITGWIWCWQNLFMQRICGYNKAPFPISFRNVVSNYRNIKFHVDDLNNFQHFGCYFQTFGNGKIIIGKGSYIAPNVGLITTNHDITNLDNHVTPKNIILGRDCWIGMNSVILPGVELGPKTIVGAGSVVTKSFIEGNCVIAGNPAKVIKRI